MYRWRIKGNPYSNKHFMIKTIESGVLTVGTDATYPPFESIDNGHYVGFDIDLMNEIGSRLGLKVKYVNCAVDWIIPALKAKNLIVQFHQWL